MSNTQTLNSNEILEVIEKTIDSAQVCVMSHLTKGKWHRLEVKIDSISRKSLIVELITNPTAGTDIQIDQPVGITFEIDFTKYLFESNVIGFEPAINEEQIGRIMIKKPITIEKMQRRSYKRVAVPNEMKVNTLFWHRGYDDNSTDVPLESYWQGRMMNLSAGGAQITVTKEQYENFKPDQFIGMQFTPLPFEKPVLVEGQIKNIAVTPDDDQMISLGIEFLGLEASTDGRDKLNKIVETIEVYQKGQTKIESTKKMEILSHQF